MKISSSHRKRGIAFTLVELLVVIGIIAILAGVILAGVSSALKFTKRTKAGAMAVNIQTAVQNYYTEYGIYPTADAVGGTPADDYYDGVNSGPNWKQLTIALCGNIDPYLGTAAASTVPNIRGIAYLSPTRSDLDTVNHTLQCPFGSSSTATYFYMVIDTDYSGVVGDSSSTKLPDFTKYSTNYMGATLANGTPGGVAVWSPCDQPLVGTAAKPSPANFWAHTY